MLHWRLYCNIQIYQINMFYAINLHDVIRQIYFKRRMNSMKKERAIQSSSFPKLHAEFSQEKCKREIHKGQKSQNWQPAVPPGTHRQSPHPVYHFCGKPMLNSGVIRPSLRKNWTPGREKRVKGQITVKHTVVLQDASRDQNTAVPTSHV